MASSIKELKKQYKESNLDSKKLTEYSGLKNLEGLELRFKMQIFEFAKNEFKSLNSQNDPNDAIWAELANVLQNQIAYEILHRFTDESFS